MTQHTRNLAIALACGAVPLLTLAAAERAVAPGLPWLAGCWQGGAGNRVIEEQWMRPRNAVMLGSARVSAGDTVKEIEFVELRLRGDSVDYIVTLMDQQRTTFSGRMAGTRGFTVHNPANSFPTTVGYELVNRDSLSAWIEGEHQGQKRRIPYNYHRVTCEER